MLKLGRDILQLGKLIKEYTIDARGLMREFTESMLLHDSRTAICSDTAVRLSVQQVSTAAGLLRAPVASHSSHRGQARSHSCRNVFRGII